MARDTAVIGRGTLCVLCPSEPARPAQHSHHIRPLEYGGSKNGEQAPLCASCHTELHRVIRAVQAGHISPENIGRPIVRRMVETFIDQYGIFQAKKAAGKNAAEDARRRISISFSEQELAELHALKRHHGQKSVEATIKALINRAVRAMLRGD